MVDPVRKSKHQQKYITQLREMQTTFSLFLIRMQHLSFAHPPQVFLHSAIQTVSRFSSINKRIYGHLSIFTSRGATYLPLTVPADKSVSVLPRLDNEYAAHTEVGPRNRYKIPGAGCFVWFVVFQLGRAMFVSFRGWRASPCRIPRRSVRSWHRRKCPCWSMRQTEQSRHRQT